MNHYQLFMKDNHHSLFSGFTTALMKAYSLADNGNKAILQKAFPEYFVDQLGPKIIEGLNEIKRV